MELIQLARLKPVLLYGDDVCATRREEMVNCMPVIIKAFAIKTDDGERGWATAMM